MTREKRRKKTEPTIPMTTKCVPNDDQIHFQQAATRQLNCVNKMPYRAVYMH